MILATALLEGRSVTAFQQRRGRAARRGLDLDFYHADENLMKAAKVIHGDDEASAKRWHEKLRSTLLVD